MAKARKGKSSGNKSKGGGVNTSAILVIAAIVAMLAIYGVNQNPDWLEQVDQVVSDNKQPTVTKSKKKETVPSKTKPAVKKEAQKTSTEVSSKKFSEKAINTHDGAVETAKTNDNLPVYTKDDNYYYTSSFDFAWPVYSQKDAIIEHSHYTLSYNEKTEQANWVAYKIKRINLESSKFDRTNNFRMDPDVKTKSASTSDYKGSGYDRGHLASAADFAWTKEGMSESFYMSNMSPQEPGFNRGIWKKLEERVRDWSKSNEELFVVTGPIFKGKGDKIGKNKVAVPDQYFKVVLELTGKEVKGIGFILDNEKSSKNLSSFAMSIDDVEKATGLDFFPVIPDPLENQIEATFNYSLWR